MGMCAYILVYLFTWLGIYGLNALNSTSAPTSVSARPPFKSPPSINPPPILFQLTTAPTILPSSLPSRSTNQPSVSPSSAYAGEKSSSSLDSEITGGIIGGVVIIVAAGLFCLFIYLRSQASMKESALRSSLIRRSENDLDRASELPVTHLYSPRGVRATAHAKRSMDTVTTASSLEGGPPVTEISWNNIDLASGADTASSIIGRGSFGVVIKARYRSISSSTNNSASKTVQGSVGLVQWDYESDRPAEDTLLAVKIITQTTLTASGERDLTARDQALQAALQEVQTVLSVERRVAFRGCIVKVYGVAQGRLPHRLSLELNVSEHARATGIVMRYEAGGSLQSLIYKTDRALVPLPLLEKLRLLCGVARGIAELHAVGVVHADIKPDNVLLSGDSPSEVRLADFGLAVLRQEAMQEVGGSSLMHTAHGRGTPVYCAPEMLYNPYSADTTLHHVAKPSRKSDVYAFALLAWELFAEKKPFCEALNEIMLSSIIHQGQRPALSALPPDTPTRVSELLKACWDTDRSRRRSAAECFSLLQLQHGLLSKIRFDVCIACDPTPAGRALACAVSYKLTQLGLRVHWSSVGLADRAEAVDEAESDQQISAVAQSKVFLLLGSQAFQRDTRCMQLLAAARNARPTPPIVPLFVEPGYADWSSQELVYLCQLRSPDLVFYDLSDYALSPDWMAEEGPGADVLSRFNEDMSLLAQYMHSCITS